MLTPLASPCRLPRVLLVVTCFCPYCTVQISEPPRIGGLPFPFRQRASTVRNALAAPYLAIALFVGAEPSRRLPIDVPQSRRLLKPYTGHQEILPWQRS